MLNFIQGKIIWVLLILFIVSVGGNVYFIMGKGIVVNNNNTSISNSESNSYANSGSLSIGFIGGDYRGNWRIKTEEIKVDYTVVKNAEESLNNFLSTLDPIQFINAKVIFRYIDLSRGYYVVSYPEIVSVKNEEHKVKKTVNGVEVKP